MDSNWYLSFILTAACLTGVVSSAGTCNDGACAGSLGNEYVAKELIQMNTADQSVELLQRGVAEGRDVGEDDFDDDLIDEILDDDDADEDEVEVTGNSLVCNLNFFEDMPPSSSYGALKDQTMQGCSDKYSDNLCDSNVGEVFAGKDLDAEFSEEPTSPFCKTLIRLFEADYDHGLEDNVAQTLLERQAGSSSTSLDASVKRKGSPRRRRRRRQPVRRRRTPSPTASPTPSPTAEPTPAPTGKCEGKCAGKCDKIYNKFVKKGKAERGISKVCSNAKCKGCSMCC